MDPSENVSGQKASRSFSSRLVNIVAPLLLAAQIVLTFIIYPMLPSTVPSHWDATGHIDSYSSKGAYVSFLPIFSLILYVFLWLMFMLVSTRAQEQNRRMGQIILTVLIVGQQSLFLIIQAILLIVALHAGRGPVDYVPIT